MLLPAPFGPRKPKISPSRTAIVQVVERADRWSAAWSGRWRAATVRLRKAVGDDGVHGHVGRLPIVGAACHQAPADGQQARGDQELDDVAGDERPEAELERRCRRPARRPPPATAVRPRRWRSLPISIAAIEPRRCRSQPSSARRPISAGGNHEADEVAAGGSQHDVPTARRTRWWRGPTRAPPPAFRAKTGSPRMPSSEVQEAAGQAATEAQRGAREQDAEGLEGERHVRVGGHVQVADRDLRER